MIAMANDKSLPAWRNFAAWSVAGALCYILAASGASALLHEGGVGTMFRSREVVGILGLGLLFSMAVVGLSSRKRPFNLRTIRNFAASSAVAVLACTLLLLGFDALARAGALETMGVSEWVAAIMGSTLIVFASLGVLAVASAQGGAGFIDDAAAADDMRERGRLFLYSFVWMVACGLLLIVLALAGPEGVLSPATVLAGALVLIAVATLLSIAVWRLLDELGRTLSHEAGNMAFYLIILLGGGWAMLAHLGFVAGPAPLDWLSLFVALMFVASFIAAGRRQLLTR
ncbi:hypothetical protein [Sphingomonas sp. DG1-23]|uniref:hypothetical protein n=1 Tax=Sphingomonas sp. DG1-23 TaxID=3068316 RepID=UPI0027401715|nr:hypothetical protein [Sphingomonas sp. DG1-23]